MAVTNYKKQEELAKQTAQATSNQPYAGMNGVSQNTANNLGNYQAGYQKSDRVTQAQNTLEQIQANKPQGYTSKYSAQLENILQQIQNPGQFKYEFNGDNLFKGYADYYTQKGKQASLDAMGQAAGLTGGYGNSYAQMVGQQQYQQNLLPLYNVGLDLYDRAYQKYADDLNRNKDLYSILQNADATDYDRYRDVVADWQREEELAANRAMQVEEMDREDYRNNLEYWTGLAKVENAAYNTEAERQEAIRQYEQDFAEKQRQYDTSLAEEQRQANMAEAYRRDQLSEQIRSTDLDEAYRRDTLSEDIRQADLNEAYRRDTLAQDIQQAELDEAYRRDNLAEQIRQADLDEAYRRDTLAWDQYTNTRDYASTYVMKTLANGQMPTDDMLRQAGITQEDAKLMLPVVQDLTKAQSKAKSGETTYYKYGDTVVYFDKNGNAKKNTVENMPAGTVYDRTLEAIPQTAYEVLREKLSWLPKIDWKE